MLTADLLKALKGYTENMQKNVCFVLQTGQHEKREELKEMLTKFASVSEKITFEERDTKGVLRSPLSFLLEVDGQASGISFSGIPGGHEFNSLVLAVLHSSGGAEIKFDDSIKSVISSIQDPLKFEVFMSLSCHNCPDVVQALNQFAVLCPHITVETIDGGLYPELVEERNIQGVPCVFLEGEVFANGKIDVAQLFDKLMNKYPHLKESAQGQISKMETQDVTIIGGGPAGCSAAIYAARKGLKVTLIADRIGGQVKDTMGIENLISCIYTTGPELSNALMAHMKEYDITLKEHMRVEEVKKGKIKTIKLSSGEEIDTKTLIIATGAKWRELGVPGEKENIGNGVAYCPHCDGPFFKGKDIAVIGGGNSGIEAALDLAGIVGHVTVLEFADTLRADQVLINQAEKKQNITIIKNAATKQILAENGKVTALEYEDRSSNESHTIDLSGVFVQIGLVPNSQFIEDLVEKTKFGEIIVNDRCETNVEGIYACGDVTTVPYKQIVISMGEGSKAALSAFDYLIKQED